MRKLFLLILAVAVVALPAFAEEKEGGKPHGIGLKVGWFLPSNKSVKRAAWNGWPMLGVEFAVPGKWGKDATLSLEGDWMSSSKTASGTKTRISMYPVLLTYRREVASRLQVGVGAGAFDVNGKTNGKSKTRIAAGGRLFIRLPISRFFGEVAYQYCNATVGTGLKKEGGFLADVGYTF